MSRKPTAALLTKYFKGVTKKVEKAEKKLNKNLSKAQASWEKQDRRNAIKSILKNFKEDMVGLEAQESTIRLYHEILDAARTEIAEMSDDEDATKKLKAMKAVFKKTDLLDEINEALESLS